ncbi:unnamed protein product [Adineta ricciae]|uniref:NAD-dependent epimerase/dehydratase domain-containing protein n=1 Tax=Adineta ricciae TaxID=249248 RepID=A0A815UFG3_ADIRI|nr:unnamed protein product [Adineta ricciae]
MQLTPTTQLKCLVGGGAGFIGSHLARRLKLEGHYVIVADWARNEYFIEDEFCNEFLHIDLRVLDNCLKASAGCDWVFNLAADMGGMGFIESNHSLLVAMVMTEDAKSLREDDAWLGKPQGAYGLEKLVSEEIAKHYGHDFSLEIRIARFHNIYGPQGTWKGGREKAPAAFCRKVLVAYEGNNNGVVQIWGDGKQTRSFCYIDDCIEGVLRIMMSDYNKPLNLGSDKMFSVNEICDIVAEVGGVSIHKKYISGPEGVRGRNSDNTRIQSILNWAPHITLKEGIRKTYAWIQGEIEKERSSINIAQYADSIIIKEAINSLQQIGEVKN